MLEKITSDSSRVCRQFLNLEKKALEEGMSWTEEKHRFAINAYVKLQKGSLATEKKTSKSVHPETIVVRGVISLNLTLKRLTFQFAWCSTERWESRESDSRELFSSLAQQKIVTRNLTRAKQKKNTLPPYFVFGLGEIDSVYSERELLTSGTRLHFHRIRETVKQMILLKNSAKFENVSFEDVNLIILLTWIQNLFYLLKKYKN